MLAKYLKERQKVFTNLGTPTFQGNILSRTGYPQAVGGWANPDGFLRTYEGDYFFSVSAFDNTKWTCWAAISSTLLGPYVVQANAIQTPVLAEGDLAANGSVLPFNGQYWHWYQTGGTPSIVVSSGDTLNEAFPQGVFVFEAGTGGYAGYFDPYVRALPSGILEMYFAAYVNPALPFERVYLHSTSLDGLTWTKPSVLGNSALPGYTAHTGEPTAVKIGDTTHLLADGTVTNTSGRRVVHFKIENGIRTPVGKLLDPEPGYLSSYDNSPYYDEENNRLIVLATNSENAEPAQPTLSDIGMWFVPVI